MNNTTKREELNFLEEYFKFYSKKNPQGGVMGSFTAFVHKTLIDTGQISEESLIAFLETHNLSIALEEKEIAIKKLQDEIVMLKKKINTSGERVVYVAESSDPCGHNARRSSC